MLLAVCVFALAAVMPGFAGAASTDVDADRLSAQLDQLSADPTLGTLALGEQARARDAVTALRDAGRRERPHYLFMAEQRVALAQAAAQAAADQDLLDQLNREHDHIMLEASQAEAAAARAELARQRAQYQAAVQQAQMLQQQGAAYSQQAQQAQAEAEQAKKLAAAQAHAAALARKEAQLAEAATRALRGSHSSESSSSGGGAGHMHLSDSAFNAGGSDLSASREKRLKAFAKDHAGQTIRIVPRAGAGMRVLAGRRAVAVRDALVAGGADPDRIHIRSVRSADQGASVDVETSD
jgi:outer membrane protein OmpA-like peptidoglycan-associated protein